MKGIFFLLCKARGNLVLSTTRFSKCATDIFYLSKIFYRMEICQKSIIGNWTHVLEEILLIARLTETCLSKSNGRFSAVILGKFGALQGESPFLLGFFSRLQKRWRGRKERGSRRLIWGKSSVFWGGMSSAGRNELCVLKEDLCVFKGVSTDE